MVSRFVIAALLALSLPANVSQRPATPLPAISVFVQTDDGGDAGELAARKTSVKDLAASLAAKKKTLNVVDDEDKALIVVEVVGRALTIPRVMIGLGPRPGESGAVGPTKTGVLRVRLTVGEYAVDFANKNKAFDNPRGWKSAADDLADQIDKWLLEHRAEIIR